MKTLDMPPFAPVLMESTRAIGYSVEAAVADIIDNSIAAGASKIDVQFSPYAAIPYVSIWASEQCHHKQEQRSKQYLP